MEHGTRSYYVTKKCRCELCSAANRAYSAQWWANKQNERTDSDTPHGTKYGYDLGCRCGRCKYAATDRRRLLVATRNKLFKAGKPCHDCGETYHQEVMEFDHVRGEKRWDVSQNMWRSLEEVEAEIAKCELVCANCHRLRTVARREAR